MKLKFFFAAVVVCSFAACKTPYKATDRLTPTADSTSSTIDTTASTNKSTLTTDSIRISAKIDSIRTPVPTDPNKMPSIPDSTKVPSIPDSTKIPSTPDSTKVPSIPVIPDSTKVPSIPDSPKVPSATDSTKMPSIIDSAKTPSTSKTVSTDVSVPAPILTAFTTQYPGATNAVWSNYDSLAVVPIDLRMAGWKKMDAEDHLVKFDLDNENYYAWYDSDGKWVGSAYTMTDFTKLPAAVNTAVKNAIKTRYAGYTISNVNREFQKDKKTYEIELKKEDTKVRMLVNADGKITQVFKYVKDKTK